MQPFLFFFCTKCKFMKIVISFQLHDRCFTNTFQIQNHSVSSLLPQIVWKRKKKDRIKSGPLQVL